MPSNSHFRWNSKRFLRATTDQTTRLSIRWSAEFTIQHCRSVPANGDSNAVLLARDGSLRFFAAFPPERGQPHTRRQPKFPKPANPKKALVGISPGRLLNASDPRLPAPRRTGTLGSRSYQPEQPISTKNSVTFWNRSISINELARQHEGVLLLPELARRRAVREGLVLGKWRQLNVTPFGLRRSTCNSSHLPTRRSVP
jgi:hypothetical protein